VGDGGDRRQPPDPFIGLEPFGEIEVCAHGCCVFRIVRFRFWAGEDDFYLRDLLTQISDKALEVFIEEIDVEQDKLRLAVASLLSKVGEVTRKGNVGDAGFGEKIGELTAKYAALLDEHRTDWLHEHSSPRRGSNRAAHGQSLWGKTLI
jgi:hypothetical protein